jgi:hypothetical protein
MPKPDLKARLIKFIQWQINLKEIGGLLMHDAVKLPETIDDVY